MVDAVETPDANPEQAVKRPQSRRQRRPGATVLAQGEPSLWLTGGGLVLCVTMIIGLLILIVYQGITTFWPVSVVSVQTVSDNVFMGEITREDTYQLNYSSLSNLGEKERAAAEAILNPELHQAVDKLLKAENSATDLQLFVEQSVTNVLAQIELSTAAREASPGVRSEFLSSVKSRLASDQDKFAASFKDELASQFAKDGIGTALRGSWVELRGTRDALLLQSDIAVLQSALLDDETTLDSLYREAMYSALGATVRMPMHRRLIRTGNYELTNEDFNWVSDFEMTDEGETTPEWAVLFERIEKGRFYGYPTSLLVDAEEIVEPPEELWPRFLNLHEECRNRHAEAESNARFIRGDLNRRQEAARLSLREVELDYGVDSPEYIAAAEKAVAEQEKFDQEYKKVTDDINALREVNSQYRLKVTTADGVETELKLADIVRVYLPNQVGTGERLSIYLSRWYEFLVDNPREANNEGGVFPAIFGTVAMTILMGIAVVPFGVLAALYLREYAKSGPLVSVVRIAINNLAGVPSIVFGVFGLGFFSYIIGSYIDGGPKNAGFSPWPPAQWFSLLTVTVICGTVAFATSIATIGGSLTSRPGTRKWISRLSFLAWIFCTICTVILIVTAPYFEGFYRARLPSPTYGTGGLLWASLTLALLTLPVVIVATEEALAAVPRSMREGSLACGATQWQTIQRIVLPRALPGIMTGMILAMARGAGEVAPLMLVGAMKLAPHLPIDIHDWSGSFGLLPTGAVHAERSFMHLGFHIYDLGFQSRNSEAAKPMVFTTTLLLIGLIALMNLVAIWLRARLKKKFQFNQF